jgi:hypothetical protein
MWELGSKKGEPPFKGADRAEALSYEGCEEGADYQPGVLMFAVSTLIMISIVSSSVILHRSATLVTELCRRRRNR